jgi:hypothetical protein
MNFTILHQTTPCSTETHPLTLNYEIQTYLNGGQASAKVKLEEFPLFCTITKSLLVGFVVARGN